MLYGILRLLFRITFRIFFKRSHVLHEERIPEKGPLLICANHPGAFLDPIVIAVLLKRPIFFLAKGEVFKSKFSQWMLPKLNVIPIYRKQDDPALMHKNKETFEKCYEHLGKGGAIIIFPEGISITERKLRKIKTGAARIVLGAEEKYGYKLGVKILPIGLNYQDPHNFRQEVFTSIAEPIEAKDFIEAWQQDSFAAAESLTEEIRKRLEAELIITNDEVSDRLVAQVERLYKDRLKAFHGVDPNDAEKDLKASQRISQVVHWYLEHAPERSNAVADRLRSYFWKLDTLRLSDGAIENAEQKITHFFPKAFVSFLLAVLGFPVFVYGILHNYLPFALASRMSKKLVKQREFQGAIGAAGGMLLFLIWHIVLGVLAWKFTHHLVFVICYVLSWLPTGLFAYIWYRVVWRMSRKWIVFSLFFRRQQLAQELTTQRSEIMAAFEALAAEFRAKEAEGKI